MFTIPSHGWCMTLFYLHYCHMDVSENSVPLNPMVLLILIPMKNCYFIGNINPTFSVTNPYIPTSSWVGHRCWAQERMKWDSSAFKAYEVSEVAGEFARAQRLGGFHKEGHQCGYDNIIYLYIYMFIYIIIIMIIIIIIYVCIYIYNNNNNNNNSNNNKYICMTMYVCIYIYVIIYICIYMILYMYVYI